MTSKKPLEVILDTNFLLLPLRFGIDIQSELERVIEASFVLVTTTAVIDELEALKTKVKPGEVKALEFALSLTERIEKVGDVRGSHEDVDDQLLRLAKQPRFIVATTDSGLRKRLRKEGFPVIYLRQSRFLSIEGIIKNISYQ